MSVLAISGHAMQREKEYALRLRADMLLGAK
jgi:hypothetical protein